MKSSLVHLTPKTALGLGLLALAGACAPGGEIAEESKTAECRRDIDQALESIALNLGLDYYVIEEDLRQIFDTGRLEKDYAGLGVRYVAHFGLDKKSDGCHLKFYKRESRQPGQSSSSTGNYGIVRLERCTCR